nr:RsmB/NOP family class I SAM-dependent RNA methyltransferase [Phaeovulum sp. NW3]
MAGQPAEPALIGWARGNRFAGSGDRAAIRDLVFDALRCRESFAALGGARSGRGLILGRCRAQGIDPDDIFTDDRHAPAPLSPDEQNAGAPAQGYAAVDCPDWLGPQLQDSLGADFAPVMTAQQARAPVFLRVNPRRASLAQAQAALARDGIATQPHPLAKTALEVIENARKIQQSEAFQTGMVELQDAASQAVVDALPQRPGMRVLDYCAGGGGKTLALAAQLDGKFSAHDIDPGRMRDLPARAARAGVRVTILPPGGVRGGFDLVLVDAPCSGSGTWRRTPDAKWRLTPARLAELVDLQAAILDQAAAHVAPGGTLAYMTCSLLRAENEDQAAAFAARSHWPLGAQRRLTPLDGGDGFYTALFTRPERVD